MMRVRHSTKADLPTLLSLACDSRELMRNCGNNNQWHEDYPSEAIFRKDIECNNSYIIEDDKCQAIGSFALVHSPEPTYNKIYNGKWIDETSTYYVVHRIMSKAGSKGIFKMVIEYCFKVCCNIRIDTHRDNTIMRHLLEKYNFSYCGIILLNNGDERLAYQLVQV